MTLAFRDQEKTEESLDSLIEELRVFAEERDWGRFHTPRNLLLALVGEVGELAEQMQWSTDEALLARMESDPGPIEEEIADVAIYLFRLSDVFGIDLLQAISRKMEANAERYQVGKYRGKSEKAPKRR